MNKFDIDEERKRRIERIKLERKYKRRRLVAGGILGVLLIGSVMGVRKFVGGSDKGEEVEPTAKYKIAEPIDLIAERVPSETNVTPDQLLKFRQLKLREQTTGKGARQSLLPKEVYLTFDDGPSKVTEDILDILKDEDVKATFFVIGNNVKNYPEITKRIIAEGHDIGVHTETHDYKQIYQNPESLKKDIEACMATLRGVLGEDFDTNLYRFPGGGFNRSSYKSMVEDLGFVYYDWNTLNGDAEGRNLSADHLLNRYLSTSRGLNRQIVLMHDAASKQTTADSLPDIINNIKKNDFKFKTLGDI